MFTKPCKKRFRFLLLAIVTTQVFMGLGNSFGVVQGQQAPSRRFGEFGLELGLPDKTKAYGLFSRKSGGMILRNALNVVDSVAAGDFSALSVSAYDSGESVVVTVSIIYNDLSDHDWWKARKEKSVGRWEIKRGESIPLSELAAFGIEPFEITVIDAPHIVFPPGEGPKVVNRSSALEIKQIEQQLDSCWISVRNRSNKNVMAYRISMGTVGAGSRSFRLSKPVLSAGESSRQESLKCPQKDGDYIEIDAVVFDDDSYEGDPKFAQKFLANADGIRIQAPRVLRRIEETLAVEDSKLRVAFENLETGLWEIPEAMNKPSALEYLNNKHPELDSKTIGELYEDLKGGLYDGRNIALQDLGQARRDALAFESRGELASAVEHIRRVLERLADTLTQIIAKGRLIHDARSEKQTQVRDRF